LIYDAWDARSAGRSVELARKALEISPLCGDAYGLLAEHAEPGSDEVLALWRSSLDAAEAALGQDAFEEFAGHFWGFLETRPYMRARFGLAQALWERGARDEAIDHLQAMLRLNPNDNQGVRYVLAAYLLEADRDADLEVLAGEYPDEGAAAWTWTMALAAFRRVGDCDESRGLLAAAMVDNAHVPAYLLGARRLPKALPHYFTVGGADEAICYVADSRSGWARSPGALDWLRSHSPSHKKSRTRSTRKTDRP
jgi:tetratricopeptide (TPR) repeat protein